MNGGFHNSVLIGHTGFVGGNLLRRHAFTHRYHSANIEELRGREAGLMVCAGVRAVKWWANTHPEEDRAGIETLLDVLRDVRAGTFVLISTVDVYPNPAGVTEADEPEEEPRNAYGRHRLMVEHFVREHFDKTCILRLPGLFGDGLKKNVIYDLLHDNGLDRVQPESAYQYYDLKRLWDDMGTAMHRKIPLLNMATEPIRTRVLIDRFFPDKTVGGAAPVAHYDMRSQHAAAWGRSDGYLYGADDVLADLEVFIRRHRSDAS